METKKLYQVSNFVIDMEVGDDTRTLVIHDLENSWGMRFSERHSLFAYYTTMVEVAKEKLEMRYALEATITVWYSLSNLGLHDVQASNELSEVVSGMQKRILESLKQINEEMTPEEVEAEEKDNEDWMKHQQTLDEMEEAAKDEQESATV